MSFGSSDITDPSPFVVRAEQALAALKQLVTTHMARDSQLRRSYGEMHDGLRARTESLRQQIHELEARLAPWMPRGESLKLAVIPNSDENR